MQALGSRKREWAAAHSAWVARRATWSVEHAAMICEAEWEEIQTPRERIQTKKVCKSFEKWEALYFFLGFIHSKIGH